MLDILGVTENWSAIENIPWTQRWAFSDDATREPVSLDDVTFTGRVHLDGEAEPVELDIQKSASAEEANILIVSCAGLPEGRHAYEIYSVSDSGNQHRLISGYIGVIKSIGKLADDTKTYASRTLSIRLPGDVTRQIRLEWNSCTIASVSAQQALKAAGQAHTDAETASKAATTATGAASTATERAKEAEGYAGAAYASKVAAGNSEAAAGTSAADAARDAKRAQDYRAGMEELASSWPQTVSNGEQAVSAAKEEAVSAIQAKQADSVLAVGRASQTAQQNITSAQNTAVQAVQTAQTEAVGTVTPLVQRAETAKADAQAAKDAAEQIANGLTISTGTVTTGAPGSQAAATLTPGSTQGSYTLDMTIPQGQTGAVDTAQAYVWTQPQTYAAMINANAGVNIPMVAGAATDTAALNRAYALGMAQAAMMHQSRTYWLTSSCTATNGVTIDHVVPGCYCTARIASNGSTSITMQTTGVVGGANYSKILGYSLPIRCGGGVPGAWMKVSMLLGAGGEWTEQPDADIDGWRWRPVAGSAPGLTRLVEITIYYQDGYKARVRELIGIGNPRGYVVRTTESAFDYDHNSDPSTAGYRLVIAQSQLSYTDVLAAGVWLIMGGSTSDTVIKLADIRGWDTYHTSGAPTLYLDAHAGDYGGVVQAEPPTILYGIGDNSYVEYGLIPYQRSWITSEAEVPYIEPEQPTE